LRDKKAKKKHPKKFHLLLDVAFAKSEAFSRLKKKANLAHAVHDLGLSYRAEDKDVYEIAIKSNRFVLTINFKHFKKLVRNGKPGIIGIESQLSNDEIDRKVTRFLSGKDPDDFLGKAIKI